MPSHSPLIVQNLPQALRKCIDLGLSPGIKGYKLYDMLSQSVFVSRDVIFDETDFPFKGESISPSPLAPDTAETPFSSQMIYSLIRQLTFYKDRQ